MRRAGATISLLNAMTQLVSAVVVRLVSAAPSTSSARTKMARADIGAGVSQKVVGLLDGAGRRRTILSVTKVINAREQTRSAGVGDIGLHRRIIRAGETFAGFDVDELIPLRGHLRVVGFGDAR